MSAPALTPAPATDWADTRLSDAYQLIDDVLAVTHPESDARALLLKAAEAVEDADLALEKGR